MQFVFPFAESLTDEESILVRGATTPAGSAALVVETVGATTPATSSDGFATWSARVPLSEGANHLTAVALSAAGDELGRSSITVHHQVTIGLPTAGSWDPQNQRYYVASNIGRMVAVDRSGKRRLVADDGRGSGESLQQIVALAVHSDGRTAYVAGRFGTVLYAVDTATGDRLRIDGGWPSMPAVSDLAFDAANNRLLVAAAGGLWAVDPSSGAALLISQSGVGGRGSGLSGTIVGVAPDQTGVRASLLVDNGFGYYGRYQLAWVDYQTGDRTDMGEDTASRRAILDEASQSLYAIDEGWFGSVSMYDLRASSIAPKWYSRLPGRGVAFDRLLGASWSTTLDGDVFMIVEPKAPYVGPALSTHIAVGSGVPVPAASAMTFDVRRQLLVLVGDPVLQSLAHGVLTTIDGTGARRHVSSWNLPIPSPTSVALDSSGSHLYGIGTIGGLEVSLTTGAAFRAASLVGSIAAAITDSPRVGHVVASLHTPEGLGELDFRTGMITPIGAYRGRLSPMVFDAARSRVLGISDQALVAVHLPSGADTTISSPASASGPSLRGARSIALDAARQRAYVLVQVLGPLDLLSVDLNTGDRSLLRSWSASSRPGVYGQGPSRAIAYDTVREVIMVSDPWVPVVYAVDPETGEQVTVAN